MGPCRSPNAANNFRPRINWPHDREKIQNTNRKSKKQKRFTLEGCKMKPRSEKSFHQFVEILPTKVFIQAIAEMCASERLDTAKKLCDLAEEAQVVSEGLAKYKGCPDMVAQSDRLLLLSVMLTQIAERILDADAP